MSANVFYVVVICIVCLLLIGWAGYLIGLTRERFSNQARQIDELKAQMQELEREVKKSSKKRLPQNIDAGLLNNQAYINQINWATEQALKEIRAWATMAAENNKLMRDPSTYDPDRPSTANPRRGQYDPEIIAATTMPGGRHE